jgi:hypothetical protein
MAPKRKAAKGVEEAIAKVSRAAGNKRKSEEVIDEKPAKKSVQEQREAAKKWAEENLSPVKSPVKSPVTQEPVKKEPVKKEPVKKEPVKKEPVKKSKAPVLVEEDEGEEEEEVRPAPKAKPQRQAVAAAAREHIRETHVNRSPPRKEVSNKSTKVAASVNAIKNKSQLADPVPAHKLILQSILYLLALLALGLLLILVTNNDKTLNLFNKISPIKLINKVATKMVKVNSHEVSANIAYFSLFGFAALALTLATI